MVGRRCDVGGRRKVHQGATSEREKEVRGTTKKWCVKCEVQQGAASNVQWGTRRDYVILLSCVHVENVRCSCGRFMWYLGGLNGV